MGTEIMEVLLNHRQTKLSTTKSAHGVVLSVAQVSGDAQLIVANPSGPQTISGALTTDGLTVASGTVTLPANSVADAALSANIPLKNSANVFSARQSYSTGGYLFMDRQNNVSTRIQWYNDSTYKAWMDYMSAPAGIVNGVTPSTGTLVTSWARRSYIENAAAYGWIFESGTNASTTPSTVFEIRSSDGAWRSAGGGTIATGGLTLLAGNVLLFQDPTLSLHAATKQYVDNLLAALDFNPSVRVATTANITLSAAQTIDGVAAIVGNRVLVKNQTTASQNGIYVVAAGAWTRALDFDSALEVTAGAVIVVEEGTLNAGTLWQLTTANPITLGSTSLTFSQIGGLMDTLATANRIVKRDASAVIFGANSATLGASTSAGAAIVADANGYVPGAALWNSGLKRPVRVATEAPLPAYTRVTNVITGTGLNSLNTAGIDGITNLAVGDRILFKDGVSTADNGIYDVTTVGVEGTTNFVLTRAPGADTSAEVRIGMTVPVSVGTENASSVYMLSNTTNPTLNSTGLTFVRVASGLGTPVKQPVRLATNAPLGANTRTGDVLTGVGVPNPVAAPTLSTASTGGTVADGDYIVAYTYVTAAGETMISPEATITTSGGNLSTITVTVPALVTGITATGIYITAVNGLTGTQTAQGTTVTTTFVLTAPPVAGAAVPASNTSYALIGAVDGVTVAVGNRILVKDEVLGANNGIYNVNVVGTASTAFVLTRSADADASVELIPGMMVTVHLGTANADSLWLLTTDAVTINSTALTFVKLTNTIPTLYKNPVRLVTTAPLAAYTRVGNIITANANGALGTIDGVTTAAGNRILLKDGAAAADNGIYVVTTLGTASVPFVLTRAEDADSSAEMSSGVIVYALAGVQYADTLWTLTSPDTAVTLNTTALTFAQYGSTSQKDPCRVATAAALPTYTRSTNTINGTTNVNLNTAGIDGITNLAVGNRILFRNGVSGADNGIWVITALGSTGVSNFQLVRAGDADTSARMRSGTTVAIEEGTLYADTLWSLITNNLVTLNTTALTFSQLGLVAAVADSTVKRGADSTVLVANHASLGAAGAVGTAIAADATGKVPGIALPNNTTKAPVRVATTAALPANTRSTNVLTASANGILPAQDGVTLVVGNRILVKDEVLGANNGIYSITSVGSAGTPWSMTRVPNMDSSAETLAASHTFVEEGTVNAETFWVLSTNNPITLNTTALTFVEFAASSVTPTINKLVKRDGNGVSYGVNHASLGSAGAAGAMIVADAGGKAPDAALSTNVPLKNAANTFTGKQSFPASVVGAASVNLAPGVDPTTPVNGDAWVTASAAKLHIGGVTKSIMFQGDAVLWSQVTVTPTDIATTLGYVPASSNTPSEANLLLWWLSD